MSHYLYVNSISLDDKINEQNTNQKNLKQLTWFSSKNISKQNQFTTLFCLQLHILK